jgi:hypothetical protein
MKSIRNLLCPLFALLLVSCFLQPAAHADSIFAFTGTITLPGNNVCGGQCLETINVAFDFEWGPVDSSFPSDNFGTLSNLTVTSTGPLVYGPGGSGVDQFPYWGLTDGLGDEVDILNLSAFSFVNSNTAPTFGASVYSCNSATCTADFAPGGFCQVYSCPISYSFSDSVMPISTPEPSSFLMQVAGLLVLTTCLTNTRRKSCGMNTCASY